MQRLAQFPFGDRRREAHGNTVFFVEQLSGKSDRRPALDRFLANVTKGD